MDGLTQRQPYQYLMLQQRCCDGSLERHVTDTPFSNKVTIVLLQDLMFQ
ncbi:hypothetical protein Pint_29691 [Pistacia integerrima]|uniref:Uncharacterized protein n=1 Tax=Pistacia integerrima TaxID=434235 RepID=A0ACC0WYD5_9ROSI|nr:hypothetical protein Pint_29691 [Pistacia integerrima]